MKLVTFQKPSGGGSALGSLDAEGRVVDLAAAHAGRTREHPPALRSMQDLIEAGPAGLALAREAAAAASAAEKLDRGAVTLLAPLPRPEQIRDCLCFEEHLLGSIAAFERMGQPVPALTLSMLETFRRRPLWYKANRFAVVGPDVEVTWPTYSSVMDYECEMAAVIGVGGRDIPKERARSHVFGYTIFNDLSARDTQVEMAGGLGPTKSKDFDGANVFGPCIVTADEIDPYDLRMSVFVNGEKRSEGHSATMKWRFEDLIAFVSDGETLHPGEILCSGTVGGGCGIEQGRLLQSGDLVELEIEGIGRLGTRVVAAGHKESRNV